VSDTADLHFARFCTRGDPADLGLVFDQTALELLGVAEHLTRDFATAEDLVQSTFLAAIQAAPRFRTGERVRPWLVGILRNLARRGANRSRNVEPAAGLHTATSAATSAAISATASVTRSAARSAAEHETSQEVQSAVAGLPQPYREVVELRLFSGLSNGGIAARLRCPPGTVRSQLSRGLEMLRLALPSGLTMSAVCVADLSAMRLALLRAAESSVTAAGVTAAGVTAAGITVTGVFMKIKLLAFASLVLLAASFGWWILDPELDPAAFRDPVPSAPTDQKSAKNFESVVSTNPRDVRRRKLEPALATRTLDSVRPKPKVEKTRLLVRVVDTEGNSVPGARVSVWASAENLGPFGINTLAGKTMSNPLEFRQAPAGQFVVADRNGCAAIDLHPLHTRLVASEPSLGESGPLTIPSGKPGSDERWCVELRKRGAIRGRVLDRFGRPIAGAKVVAQRRGPLGISVVETTGRGAFAVPSPRAGVYYLSATKGQQKTESVGVHVGDDLAPRTVELCVPGAFGFVGSVLDPIGKPVPGAEVIVWRVEEGSKIEYPFSRQARTGDDGSYEILLGRAGTYRIVARSKDVANSSLAELELTKQRPRVDSVLRLQHFAEIRGRVIRSGGQPLIGIRINADVGVGGDSVGMPLRRIYGPDPYVGAGVDETGAFTIRGLHPDGVYKVTVFLDPKRYLLTLCEPRVRAGTTDLRFVAEYSQRTGAMLHCRITTPGNKPVGKFGARLWKYYEDVRAYPQPVILDPAAAARGEFIVKDLKIGAEYSLVVQAHGFAPLLTSRFRMEEARQDMDLAIHGFSDVHLMVPGNSRSSRANLRITITRQMKHPEPLDAPPVIADAGGRATLKLPPGKFRATCGGMTADFNVVPGRRTVVHLK
jgi:RNA polymerase sigma factor (sigma-70 family)